MGKIFGYELRRLLGNKFSAGLAVLALAYSYWVMNEEVVAGVANTAPFSPWSFGAYLGQVMPVLVAGLFFFLFLLPFARGGAGGAGCFDAAVTAPGMYRAVCCGACAAAFGAIALVPILYAGVFYAVAFGFTGFGSLLGPLVLAVLPPFLLALGGGMLAGRLHRGLPFALIPAALLLAVWTPPEALDLFGTGFFAGYPAGLGTVDPGFSVPAGQAAGRAVAGAAGAAMAALALRAGVRKAGVKREGPAAGLYKQREI